MPLYEKEGVKWGITYLTYHCDCAGRTAVFGVCRSLYLCSFPKRFGLEETRKIELGKPYLKGMDFPAKETYTVRSYDDYVLHAEYIETDPQSKKICDYQSWLYLYQIWIL